MYHWGRGDYGVFGDGNNSNLKVPHKNEYFEMLAQNQNLQIVKIKSANNYSVALMSRFSDFQIYRRRKSIRLGKQ